ncbi:MAG: hypothetical protein M1825_002413 [Sarcosagium campestre]|nr:MAG: hypothetical protein M1825_002413 [Sarcosagium campestre]
MATNTLTLFALSILLIRSIWSLATNTTTIEGWELERHTALVRRARLQGGFVWGPDGIKVPIRRQEFPYDIGIWKNVRQGMGGSNNVISWFWPFAASPSIQSALSFEVNGFEDATVTWPPPDPDRIPRLARPDDKEAFTYRDDGDSFETASGIEAFRQRQQADLRRRRHLVQDMPPDQISDNDDDNGIRMEAGSDVDEDAAFSGEEEEQVEEEGKESESDGEGGELWTNSEGDRLKDFGVDEDAEGYTASR